jgi:hypothetical protein
MPYVIRLRNRRTGEWFRSRLFESFEAAARYGDRLDGAEWTWSIDEA